MEVYKYGIKLSTKLASNFLYLSIFFTQLTTQQKVVISQEDLLLITVLPNRNILELELNSSILCLGH